MQECFEILNMFVSNICKLNIEIFTRLTWTCFSCSSWDNWITRYYGNKNMNIYISQIQNGKSLALRWQNIIKSKFANQLFVEWFLKNEALWTNLTFIIVNVILEWQNMTIINKKPLYHNCN